MKWRIVFARTAERELARLSSDAQLRVASGIRSLEGDPISTSTKRLKGRREFRLRVGDYRVLYRLEHQNRVLTIVAIGHRRDVYR
jgi:mRNA interferase RelE/StbE